MLYTSVFRQDPGPSTPNSDSGVPPPRVYRWPRTVFVQVVYHVLDVCAEMIGSGDETGAEIRDTLPKAVTWRWSQQ